MNPWKVQKMLDNIWYYTHSGDTLEYSNIFDWNIIQNVYLVSDTHFFHKNIAEYCNRPPNWREMIVERWNEVVPENGTVLHLGDFSFRNKEFAKDIRRELNGDIYLIKGNHDRHGVSWYADIDIYRIKGFKILSDVGVDVYFTHRPYKPKENESCVNICGHMHQNSPFIWENNNVKYCNVSVEQLDYRPIQFKNLFSRVYNVSETVYNV